MSHQWGGILVLGLALPVVAAEREDRDQPATPAEQYKALLKEHQLASSGGALSDQERMKFVGLVSSSGTGSR